MQTYQCPQCHGEISLADVNVAADVALCRKCGKATPFSLVSGVAELSPAQLDEPAPKGITVRQAMVGGTEIVYRRMSFIVFFLIPFMLFWSGFSLSGIYGKQIQSGKFDLDHSLFGLPFLIGTLLLLWVIVFLLFGKWRVRLDRGRGEVFVGVGPVGWTRNFAYGPESVVSLELMATSKNNVPQKAISVKTGNAQIKFGTMIPENVKCYIGAMITKACAAG
jgi:hypothetical protein